MARSVNKKSPKSAASQQTLSHSSLKSADSGLPKPFQDADPDLTRPFLSGLARSHVYLVHVDDTSPILKRRVFLVTVCMNLIILALLALRLYYAVPTYFDLIVTIYGFDYTGGDRRKGVTFNDLLSVTATRFSLFLLDYIIFVLVGSWPWEFMFGNKYNDYTGPFSWRREVRFQPQEIIVRRSRAWDRSMLSGPTPDHEQILKSKITPAMEDKQLAKTGYLMLDKDWDLDFAAMLKAHHLVHAQSLQISDFEPAAFVCYQNRWFAWRKEKPLLSKSQSESSPKMQLFKDKLAAMGGEDIFYRWIEIVQFESSVPDGFNEARKASALDELSSLLRGKGIDYHRFIDDIGGAQNLPGMEMNPRTRES